jgi:hypothetical protein
MELRARMGGRIPEAFLCLVVIYKVVVAFASKIANLAIEGLVCPSLSLAIFEFALVFSG